MSDELLESVKRSLTELCNYANLPSNSPHRATLQLLQERIEKDKPCQMDQFGNGLGDPICPKCGKPLQVIVGSFGDLCWSHINK